MRIFVAGGTGVVGRRAVPALVAQGHDVTVVVRSPENAAAVSSFQAAPVEVSLFDPARLRHAVEGHDVVINLATSIPPYSRAARSSAWHLNDRIRAEGSKNLVGAALALSVERFVQESVAFLYGDGGQSWIHEDHPIAPTPITASAAEAESQTQRLAEHGQTVVVLRFGSFYGPDSGHTVTALRLARLGFGTLPGPRTAYVSSVSTDDAAAAVVAAASAAPGGTFNVVDDEPVIREDFDQVLARAVGRRRLRPMPPVMVRMMSDKLDHVTRSQRVSNEAIRTATSWRPRFPSIREGLPPVARAALDRRTSVVGKDRG